MQGILLVALILHNNLEVIMHTLGLILLNQAIIQ
jgi:hypothetical protein